MAMTGIQGSSGNYEEYLRQNRVSKQNEISLQQPDQLQDINSTPESDQPEQLQNIEIVPKISAENPNPVVLFENERLEGGLTNPAKDSDIGQLDIQQAISDMQKDSILHQYQYFVGTSSDYNMLVNDQDGVVLKKISQNS